MTWCRSFPVKREGEASPRKEYKLGQTPCQLSLLRLPTGESSMGPYSLTPCFIPSIGPTR